MFADKGFFNAVVIRPEQVFRFFAVYLSDCVTQLGLREKFLHDCDCVRNFCTSYSYIENLQTSQISCVSYTLSRCIFS